MAMQSAMKAADPDAPKEPLSWVDIILSGPVIVKVGPEEKQYHVHKALITRHSDYFRNAFNGSWKEADENCISLEDVETTTFEVFVHWLYRSGVPLAEGVCHILGYSSRDLKFGGFISDEEEEGQDALFLTLTKAIVFGDRFLSPRFYQAANNALVDFVIDYLPCSGVVLLSAAQYAHENLPADSKINQFLLWALYTVLSGIGVNDLAKEMTEKRDMSSLLLARLLERFNSAKSGVHYNAWGHRCPYHEHTDDQERNGCLECKTCKMCEKRPQRRRR